MREKRILITDDVHPLLIEGLQSRNWQVDYQPTISLRETIEIIEEYHGLIINSKILADKHLLAGAKKLEWIARLGSGMEIIDIDLALEKGILLINTPEANCNAVAEHALAMILNLFRNINKADREIRNKLWNREQNRGEELEGKTIGIIGYGHTGSRFEGLLRGFNVKVMVYDKYKQLSNEGARYSVVRDVNEIKESADLISLHLPLTPETRYLIDDEFIATCKNSFYLINTSRGQIVKTGDLIRGLESGKIKGACLDVFENENPNSYSDTEHQLYDSLYNMQQVILSPHIAGWTHQSKQKIAATILRKLDESSRFI